MFDGLTPRRSKRSSTCAAQCVGAASAGRVGKRLPPPARGQFRQWNSLGSLVPSAADRSRSRRARPIRLAEPQRQKSEAAIQRTAYHDQDDHDDKRQNLEQPRVRGRAVRVEGALAPPFSHVVRPRRLPAGPCTTRPEIINPGRGFRQRKHRLRVRRYPARHRIQ